MKIINEPFYNYVLERFLKRRKKFRTKILKMFEIKFEKA